MRCFIAAEVPSFAIQSILECAGELNKELWRPVKPQHMHITIKFLGDVGEDEMQVCKSAIEDCAHDQIPFKIYEGGAFPNPKYARVLFAKVDSMQLQNIAKCIHNKTKGIGDERPFVPHITIARARNRKVNANAEIKKLGKLSIESKVKAIALKKSTLTPNGPVYEDIYIKKI